MLDRKFSRQTKLKEVGATGQAAISNAAFEVPGGPAGELAVSYLERAGATRIATAQHHQVEEFPHADVFANVAAKELAHGAWLALSELRKTLGLSE